MSSLNLSNLRDLFAGARNAGADPERTRRDVAKLAVAGLTLVAALVLAVRYVATGWGPRPVAAVFTALSLEDADALRRAVDDDADVLTELDPDGNAPLHVAVLTGSEPMARLLLDAGADPNAPNRDGWTPLALAVVADRNQAAVARLLVGAGARTDHVLPDGQSLLHVAAATRGVDPKLLAILTQDRAALARRDAHGKLPIDVARERRQPNVVLALSKLSAASGRAKSN